MNNGLLHAVGVMDPDAIAAAADEYRYFGLDAAAAVGEEVAGRLIEALDLECRGEQPTRRAARCTPSPSAFVTTATWSNGSRPAWRRPMNFLTEIRCRELVDKHLSQLPAQLRSRLTRDLLEPLDDRFRAATEDDGGDYLRAHFLDKLGPTWRWSRRPRTQPPQSTTAR